MPDMLVKLYQLPSAVPSVDKLASMGITVRRSIPPEKHRVVSWVRQQFGEGWASECDVAFSSKPVGCFIAVQEPEEGATEGHQILGFACYDATNRNFFGPTGVIEHARGKGIGKALLLVSLHAMREKGYAYGIIGGAGPTEYYEQVVGAIPIEGSTPGIYRGMLR